MAFDTLRLNPCDTTCVSVGESESVNKREDAVRPCLHTGHVLLVVQGFTLYTYDKTYVQIILFTRGCKGTSGSQGFLKNLELHGN